MALDTRPARESYAASQSVCLSVCLSSPSSPPNTHREGFVALIVLESSVDRAGLELQIHLPLPPKC